MIQVLDNDYDPDGDALSVVPQTSEANGYECDSKRCWFWGPSGWDGTAFVFSYTIDDGKGGTAQAMITVTGV